MLPAKTTLHVKVLKHFINILTPKQSSSRPPITSYLNSVSSARILKDKWPRKIFRGIIFQQSRPTDSFSTTFFPPTFFGEHYELERSYRPQSQPNQHLQR